MPTTRDRSMTTHARSAFLAGAALLAVTLASWPTHADAQIYNVHHYTNRDGLPQRQILAVHQGHEGYIWFGTFGGLSRFNGSEIRTYTAEDGLSMNVVSDIVEDDRGRLHLATLGGGFCTMEAEEFWCFDETDGLADDIVEDLELADDGSLWLATAGGLSHRSGGVFTSYGPADGLPSEKVLSLEGDEGSGLWIGTREGLARLQEGQIRPVHPSVLSGHAVKLLFSLPEGLLVGTDVGLYLLADGTLIRLPVQGLQQNVSFNHADRDASGVVWIGTSDGLLRYDGESFTRLTEANGLLRNLITQVMLDREGNIWLGSEAGASKLVPGPFKAYALREGLPNSFARALAEDGDGRLWVGTRYGAAVQEGDQFREILAGEDLRDGRIYSVAPAPDGGMLLGTFEGLVHWKDGEFRTYLQKDGLPSSFVPSLLSGPAGRVWVGTENGLARWQDGRPVAFPDDHPLAGLFVVSLAYDLDGRLWIGLRSGGVRIWDGRKLERLDAGNGLTDQAVWSMDVDSAGRMWIGTNGDGAFRVDGSEIRRFTTSQGLVNDFVWQVLSDSRGSTWLYTNRGLDRYRGGEFRHYGIADGLVDLEGSAAAALEDSAGELWFGSSAGLLKYDPAGERPNRARPPVVIETATVDGDSLASGGRVESGAGLLRISYAALSFRDEESVRYRYRLVDDEESRSRWSDPVSENVVTFAGLWPGDYTFEVVGINNDGVASQTPATFSFTVLPAFWQTWWFWLLGAGLLAGVGAAVPVIRTRHLKTERARLEQRVAEHTRDLEEANTRLREEIQERERIQEALKASESRLREIVENSTNVFYSHTPDHELTYISPQVEELLGVPPEEALIRWTELATDNPENEAGYEATMRAIETGRRQAPYELELHHTDGGRVWVRVTETPVVRDGETVAIVGSLTDVTETRRAEEERKRLEERLHQSQKLEAVGRLAGGVAHDFNNILTSILGHADLVSADLGPDHPMNPELQEVAKACNRAASLVEQLLAFGRKQVVKPTEVDLDAAVDDAIKMLKRVLGEDVRLVTDLCADPTCVVMDRGQLDQILVNLAVNARDAMPQGGTLSITTGTETLDAPPVGREDIEFVPGEYAFLRVTDTGTGMDPDTVEHAFEPFFTTKETGKGTGLGLATVYGIVKQNDGYVWVDSEVGAGTTFEVYLPAQPGGAPEPDTRTSEARENGGEPKNCTVLVVEDEEAVRKLVARVLEKEGYRVFQASDGPEAVEMARERTGPIDLLVTDMIMPGMTGRAVAEAITARHEAARVLYISGYTDDILGKRGIVTPEVELLEKPFDPTDLLDRIQRIMDG